MPLIGKLGSGSKHSNFIKQITNLLRLWRKRGIYDKDVLNSVIKKLIKGLSSQDIESKKPPIPEYLSKFAKASQEMARLQRQQTKFQNQLDTLTTKSGQSLRKSGAREKLVKYRKSLENHQKSRTQVL